MANHGFLTTKKHLKPDIVDADIREIVSRRFNDKLIVKRDETYWTIEPKDNDDYRFEFSINTVSTRKLEFRHPPSDWAFWAQMVVHNELAVKYDGTISDEGVTEKWKMSPEKLKKYFHYRDWVDSRWKSSKSSAATKLICKKFELMGVPKELRDL